MEDDSSGSELTTEVSGLVISTSDPGVSDVSIHDNLLINLDN